jgi:putative glycerol-1-phosphate prenyltransferase/phosphoglycerol geranylgeranyltransferase
MIGPTETALIERLATRKALFFVLLDPDSGTPDSVVEAGMLAAKHGADALLLGGSFIGNPYFGHIAAELKKTAGIPVILFPGGAAQVVPGPDAILFTTMLSGRNPQYLVDEQVRGGLLVKGLGMEAIPTAYLLIESGRMTAVEYISNTKPLPADKPGITAAHAVAAELLGLRWVYLEAGSGAQNPVPPLTVAAVRKSTGLKVIVGGGLRKPEDARARVLAGADAIVVGNLFEKDRDPHLFEEFAKAVHEAE